MPVHYPDDETDWSALAVSAQSGDKKAYTRLLKALAPYIKRRIAGGLANPDWVDDITQEVLISVHKSLNTYSPDRPFKPWLNAIIQFRRSDFLRAHYRGKRTKEESAQDTEIFAQNVTSMPHAGELKDMESALSSLPEKQQKIFTMMKIEGYSAQEVAKEMDMSISAVKVSAHRTSNKLRDMLG